MNRWADEKGAIPIVEGSILFPICFLVLFLMLFFSLFLFWSHSTFSFVKRGQ